MRSKRLKYTVIFSLIYQIVAIICGFILPRIILQKYSSDVNGLVNSITSFLNIITFLDLGVGTVVCSALYKPLAKKDVKKVSKIYKSASKYFRNIGKVLVVYMLILPLVYVISPDYEFDIIYTGTLVFSMGLSLFSQYYFGMVNRLLITADQKEYIQYILQTITLVLTTIVCSFLMWHKVPIQIVKLVTSLIFLIRPLFLTIYVKKKYNLDTKIEYSEEPIKQKWNGISQHIAAVILDSTDVMVLTVFSTLANVSIYSVYYLVIHGLRQLIQSLTSGLQSYFGNIIALDEKDKLAENFRISEWVIHTFSSFVFGCTIILIIPFVQVYTKGINDANYIQPVFGLLLTIAFLCYCLRIPYHLLVKAKGHYKETQVNYLIATILNIVVSLVFVNAFGLIGVAIGTLVAMLYQTFWMANYCYSKILNFNFSKFIRLIIFDAIIILFCVIVSFYVTLNEVTYTNFFIIAVVNALFVLLIVFVLSLLFYKNNLIKFIRSIFKVRSNNNG